jgi:hypothetical protein
MRVMNGFTDSGFVVIPPDANPEQIQKLQFPVVPSAAADERRADLAADPDRQAVIHQPEVIRSE